MRFKNKTASTNFFLFLIALVFSLKTQALTIEISARGLTSEQLAATNRLVNEALFLLPSLVKERMQTTLKLEFRDLGKKGRWGQAQHQLLKESKILLDQSLLPDIVAGVQNARTNLQWATRLKTYNDIALGTVLHEIAHFFDEQDSTTISASNEFLQLNYFDDARDKSRNTLAAKSPNWYEFKSAAEAFAVNFEFFLLDPDFQCRKPLLYEYFANRVFKHTPFKNVNCTMVKKVFEVGDVLQNGNASYVDLDFNRLYQVHYLLADKGNDASSKWGHSMLRLVFCAPERLSKGPECLKDLAYHKVISFRAVPTSDTVNFMKGLTGKYPSFLFILPFTQVIHEYTVDELRPVESVPLKMDQNQMNRLLLRTLEMHWSYRGKYYFISNNCAVETLNLLKTVLSDIHRLKNVDAITPQGLLKQLTKVRIADPSIFTDLNEAWKQGLYYYPNDKIPKIAYAKLKQSVHRLNDLTLEDFVFTSDSVYRGEIYREIFEKTGRSKTEFNELYSSALYLENQINKNIKKRLYSEALLRLAEMNTKDNNGIENKNTTWTDSWYYGYGIPTEKDFQQYYIVPNQLKQAQQKEAVSSERKQIESLWNKELKREYEQSGDNLSYIISTYSRP